MNSSQNLLGAHAKAPLSSVGFIEASLSTALNTLNSWMLELEKEYTVINLDTVTKDTFKHLLPITKPWNKELLISLTNGWTMYLNNGGDPFPFSYIAKRLKCRYIIAVSSEFVESENASTQFQLFGPTGEPPLDYIRTISKYREDGAWKWDATGQLQNFEQTDRYMNRLITYRFDNELLLKYLAAYDLYPTDTSTYTNAAMIEYTNR